ncbi:hypothetical protein [Paenibacillus humicola]|uniref:hypothetical protein n=1 Tax=Paenibacillus humicola TaxID=3110540 RepID=UPI00237C0E23|nr:hypothetical protein [Paenibacillus humicola]
MWVMVGILSAAAIFLIEVPNLFKKRLMKELTVFLFLLLTGTALSILLSLHVKLPNPVDWLTFIYQPFSKLLENALT